MVENTKNIVIVDASWVLAYLMPDEVNVVVDLSFNLYRTENLHLVSTTLLPWEVVNSLKSAKIRQRIDQNLANLLSKEFGRLMILNLPLNNTSTQDLLNIALKYNLSVYDAGYLQLAIEHRLPLLTNDEKLKKVAKKLLPQLSLSRLHKHQNMVHDRADTQYKP